MLHGALLAYYDDEAAAQEPDEAKCRGVSIVVEAHKWGNDKPAQIPDSIWREHKSTGLRIVTEDKDFMVHAESEVRATTARPPRVVVGRASFGSLGSFGRCSSFFDLCARARSAAALAVLRWPSRARVRLSR